MEENKFAKYFGEGWASLLMPFLTSQQFAFIGNSLREQAKNGLEIAPHLPDIFRAFKECPLEKLHTVILGMDAYPLKTPRGTYMADGLAFSSNTSVTLPKSLGCILEAIDVDVYEGLYVPTTTMDYNLKQPVWDLKHWANQGILLINCGLTTVINNPGTHILLWNPFIKWLLKTLNDNRDSLGVVLIGSHARCHRGLLNNPSYGVYECEHPAGAIHKKRAWKHEHVFKKLTDFQQKRNNIKIKW